MVFKKSGKFIFLNEHYELCLLCGYRKGIHSADMLLCPNMADFWAGKYYGEEDKSLGIGETYNYV